jgi:galactonate dehydratase
MKIERVESILAGNSQIVRIFTDNGLVGVGQSACWGYLEATDAVVKKFADYLVGKDPLDIEHHWQYLYRMGPFRGSVLMGAVSAVDIALWDIKGKSLEAPVWQLLGGKVRNKIRLHLLMGGIRPDAADQGTTAQGLLLNSREAAEEGFTAIKTDPLPDGFQSMTLPRLIHDTRENVAAMREGDPNGRNRTCRTVSRIPTHVLRRPGADRLDQIAGRSRSTNNSSSGER